MTLNKTRPVGMGTGSISECEIDALQRNRRIRLSGWECDAIHALDQKVQGVMAEMNKPKPTKKGK